MSTKDLQIIFITNIKVYSYLLEKNIILKYKVYIYVKWKEIQMIYIIIVCLQYLQRDDINENLVLLI